NFPLSLRPQGREIVRTWLYYTMLKSWLVRRSKPFHRAFIHGLGLDARGRAMHRTQGNVIDPWPLLKKHGADAIRLFVAGETNPGDDFRISEAKIGGAAKFVTKLWNVARFISSFEEPEAGKLQPSDEWILAELNRLVESCRGAYEDLNLFLPANRGRDFLWNLFAPHYVEMVKARAYEGDTGARWTLHACLRDLLRLLAPVTPFSTDKIWRSMYGGSVHAERFPMPRDGIPASRADFTEGLLAFNADVWKRKRDQGLSLNVELPGVDIPPSLKPFEGDLKRMHHLA
ncbi:MAG: valine--tRNA ligase, partial [Methanobacteriota archaeon]